MEVSTGTSRESKITSRLGIFAPGLLLAFFLNPTVDALAQQLQPKNPAQTSAQLPKQYENDNAPVPPMPPLDPAQVASPSDDLSLPDSPGAVELSQLEAQQSSAPATGGQQSEAPQQSATPQQAAPQLPSAPREPLGAAAAQTVPTLGVAASRPAGAALAPAKQRRIRTILIRTGAVIGAAAAVGVTMALTEGSPSKPPGAH
jgi:hypothetical protein